MTPLSCCVAPLLNWVPHNGPAGCRVHGLVWALVPHGLVWGPLCCWWVTWHPYDTAWHEQNLEQRLRGYFPLWPRVCVCTPVRLYTCACASIARVPHRVTKMWFTDGQEVTSLTFPARTFPRVWLTSWSLCWISCEFCTCVFFCLFSSVKTFCNPFLSIKIILQQQWKLQDSEIIERKQLNSDRVKVKKKKKD